MDLVFANKNIRHLCESYSKARKFFGDAVASKLASRLADIDAVVNASELKAGNPHELAGEQSGQLALELCDGYVLVLAAVSDGMSTVPKGAVDWRKATRAMVLRIEKHD